MTSEINNTVATALTTGENITLTVGEQTLNLNVEEVTNVLVVLLAARKEAYETRRVAKAAQIEARKAERAATKLANAKKAKARKAEQVKKLEAKLAELKKAA